MAQQRDALLSVDGRVTVDDDISAGAGVGVRRLEDMKVETGKRIRTCAPQDTAARQARRTELRPVYDGTLFCKRRASAAWEHRVSSFLSLRTRSDDRSIDIPVDRMAS